MLTSLMFKTAASRVLLAFSLVAGQSSFAALPPSVDMEDLRLFPPPGPRLNEEEHRPAVNPYNQDFADALDPKAAARYAGMPVIGIDVSTLLEGEHTFGEDAEGALSMQSLYMHDVLERGYPHVLKRMSYVGRERMFHALDSVIKGFREHPNQPQRIPGVVCFIPEPGPNGYYNAAETLDMLIASHRCNPKYGALRLRPREKIPFRPQALEDALKVARKVAKIGQLQIDMFTSDLMAGRFEELQHMVLVTYVEHLNVKSVTDRNDLYLTLNNRLHAMHSEMGGRTPGQTIDIVRREWQRGQGITSYFAAVYLKALVSLDSEMAGPLVKGLDIDSPLSSFVSLGDHPAKPAVRTRVAPSR